MSQADAEVINNARAGDRFLVEVRCIMEQRKDDKETTLFLFKEDDDGVVMTEKFFKVDKLRTLN